MILYYSAFSQNDKICVPRADLVYKLAQVERLKVDSAERDLLRDNNAMLLQRISAKDNTIVQLESALNNAEGRVRNYQLIESNQSGQIRLLNESVASLNQTLRKQKRKTTAITIGGVLVTGALTFLLLTK